MLQNNQYSEGVAFSVGSGVYDKSASSADTLKVSKHNQVILIAESDADLALFGMWAEGHACRIDSSEYSCDKSATTKIALGFWTDKDFQDNNG